MSMISKEEREFYTELIDKYVEKQFGGKSRAAKDARLAAMGFKRGTKPGVDAVKKKLLLSQYWLMSPKIDPDKDTWLYGDSKIGGLLSTRMM